MISGIIKVKVSVISRAERISEKPDLIIVLLAIIFGHACTLHFSFPVVLQRYFFYFFSDKVDFYRRTALVYSHLG